MFFFDPLHYSWLQHLYQLGKVLADVINIVINIAGNIASCAQDSSPAGSGG